jgi:hypothetical protein
LNNNYSCHIQLIIVDLLYTEDQWYLTISLVLSIYTA